MDSCRTLGTIDHEAVNIEELLQQMDELLLLAEVEEGAQLIDTWTHYHSDGNAKGKEDYYV